MFNFIKILVFDQFKFSKKINKKNFLYKIIKIKKNFTQKNYFFYLHFCYLFFFFCF